VVLFKTILVPTDFSDRSHAALVLGRTLAASSSATLHVLHVTASIVGAGGAAFWGLSVSELRTRLEEETKSNLEAILPSIDGMKTSLATRVGHPLPEIVSYASDQDVDLIVMATRGRGLAMEALTGGLVQRVVSKAPCPVLVVRAPRHEVGRS